MGKTINSKEKIIKCGIIVLLVVFLVSAALLILGLWEKEHGEFPEATSKEDEFIEYNGKKYVFRDNIETFLVIGLDKFDGEAISESYNNDKQADFIMLFVFDDEAKKSSVIYINRDTMANVNLLALNGNTYDTVVRQIALAHTQGNGKDVSCHNVASSVSDLLLGTKVNHYISLTLDSVPIVNDLVGGVEVTVLDDFSGVDNSLVKGEKILLNGEQALNYVRTRENLEDNTNIARMKRQQQYMEALYKKAQSCMLDDETFIAEAVLKISDHMVSDRSVTQLEDLAKKFDEYEFSGSVNIEGESKVGEQYMEFYPDENSIKEIVSELFCVEKSDK